MGEIVRQKRLSFSRVPFVAQRRIWLIDNGLHRFTGALCPLLLLEQTTTD